MGISSFLGSDAGVTLIGSVFGSIWTLFRSRDWYVRTRKRRFAKALRAVEAGVDKTYREYVRSVKAAREDGRLTDEEARTARHRARNTAIAYGTTTGVDVLREVGASYMDLWINKLVRKAKKGMSAS